MPVIARMIALGWGDPDTPDFRAKHVANLRVAGVVLPVNKNPDIQYLFRVLVTSLDKMGAKVAEHRDDWGYANRAIRGAKEKSNHAWALAVDIDALENLLGTSRTSFPIDRTRALVKRLGMTKADGTRVGIRWGYDYEGRKDPMHFEFVGSVADARAIVRKLRTASALKALAAALSIPAAAYLGNAAIAPDGPPPAPPKPAPTTSTAKPAATTSTTRPASTKPTTAPTVTKTVRTTATVTATRTRVTTRTVTRTRTATSVVRRDYVVVRPGDTLYALALDLGTTVARLRQLNPGVVPAQLVPGSRLRVP